MTTKTKKATTKKVVSKEENTNLESVDTSNMKDGDKKTRRIIPKKIPVQSYNPLHKTPEMREAAMKAEIERLSNVVAQLVSNTAPTKRIGQKRVVLVDTLGLFCTPTINHRTKLVNHVWHVDSINAKQFESEADAKQFARDNDWDNVKALSI